MAVWACVCVYLGSWPHDPVVVCNPATLNPSELRKIVAQKKVIVGAHVVQ